MRIFCELDEMGFSWIFVFSMVMWSNKYSQEGEPDKGLVHGGVVAQGDGVVREVELGGEEGHLVFIYLR